MNAGPQSAQPPPETVSVRLSSDGLLDQIGVAIIATDAQGTCVRMNAMAQALLGYTEAEAAGQNMHDLVHSRHLDGSPYAVADCPVYHARANGTALALCEEVLWTKSGEAVPVEWSGSPLKFDNGETGIVLTLKDLRDIRQAERRYAAYEREQAEVLRQRDATARIERELAEAEAIRRRDLSQQVEQAAAAQLRSQYELLAAVAQAAPIGIAVLDRDLRVLWNNPAFHAFVAPGQPRYDLANLSFLQAAHLDEFSEAAKMLRRVGDTGDPFRADSFPLDRPEHGASYWWWSVTRLAGGDLLSIGTDVTEQKKAHDALVQSDKMAAVGRLAASISHEINNPLEAVTNLLYLIEQDTALSQESREYVRLAESELARVSQIASQTLRFHRHSLGPVTVQPRQLIDPVVALYQGRLKHSRIDVQVDVRDATPVMCFENDVRQILNNLLGNAIDAMPKGGIIRFRSHAACCARSGRHGVRISIADNGHGMTPQTVKHIFEPFYTTKGASGSGLGLWISHTLAHRHGGALQVRSRQHRSDDVAQSGTTFSLFLPNIPTDTTPDVLAQAA